MKNAKALERCSKDLRNAYFLNARPMHKPNKKSFPKGDLCALLGHYGGLTEILTRVDYSPLIVRSARRQSDERNNTYNNRSNYVVSTTKLIS